MSGHSKWHSIKHKKGATDAKRGKIFSKVIKELTVAARLGGGDPEANPRLRMAMLKAKGVNMPKDNIERAIKKGTGDLNGANYVELIYEAYAPGGAALIIEAMTDNKNRTAADVRSILTKGGGSLGETGCVSYMFSKKGTISFDAARYSEEEIFEAALEAGAEDVAVHGDSIEVTTAPEDFAGVLTALNDGNFEEELSDVGLIPDSHITLDPAKTEKVMKLIEHLEDCEDVQSVASNLEVPDDFEPSE